MKILVLIAQRKQCYEGEYGLEALACMSEYLDSDNPDFLLDMKKENDATQEFESVQIVCLDVDEVAIRKVLFPATESIKATVIDAEPNRIVPVTGTDSADRKSC